MDKTKYYKMIDAITNNVTRVTESPSPGEKLIGTTGKFLRFTKGMRFEFCGDDINNCLHSSIVTRIEEMDDIVKVQTLNTLYVFERL